MSATESQGWWISANQYDIGPSSGSISTYQKANADNIYSVFSNLGWTVNAIAGMVGNMQYESCVDPACVYPKGSFPNGGASLNDISNQYALSRKNPAYGLVQWKGLSSAEPIANQIVSYAYRHGSEWYEGTIQMDRLTWEYTSNVKWKDRGQWTGNTVTFSEYASSTDTPENLAKIFMEHYEVTWSKVPERQGNARLWYDYFEDTPPGPGPGPGPEPVEGWITGEEFAQIALSYNGQYLPYDQYDCIGFVNLCWQQIPASSGSLPNGTNRIWRSTLTYQTTSPDGQNPCPVLWYKDTLANCISNFGGIPAGTLLFHKISDEGPPALPPQYAGDGIGNFAHVGIYCGNNEVMQSGGRDSGSVPGGGVHKSTYDPNAWNYAAFVVWVDPTGGEPGPGPEPEPEYWRYLLYAKMTDKRRMLPNVRKYYTRFL